MMMKRLKIVAALLVAAFAAQDVLAYAPHQAIFQTAAPKPDIRFTLPESVALVDDWHKAPASSRPQVILFQDAHTNYSGQENLSRALDLVLASEKTSKVLVEGGWGDVTLSHLKGLVERGKLRETARRYLRSGVLHGEEFLNLTSDRDFDIVGAEDEALYRQTVKAYWKATRTRKPALRYLDRIERGLAAQEDAVFNPALAAFEKTRGRYRTGELALTEYFAALYKEAKRTGVYLGAYCELTALRRLTALEKKIDFDKASAEEREAIGSLSAADRDELGALRDQTPARLKGTSEAAKGYFLLLEEKLQPSLRGAFGAEAISQRTAPQNYPNLTKYFRYLHTFQKLSASGVLDEMALLEKEVLARLARTRQERLLVDLEDSARLVRKLLELQITPKELAVIASVTSGDAKQSLKGTTPNLTSTDMLTGFVNGRIYERRAGYEGAIALRRNLDHAKRVALNFYRLASERDRIFLKAIEKNLSADEPVILITGGFHTPALKEGLKSRGLSFVSVLPQVREETDHKRYEKLLLASMPQSGSSTAIARAPSAPETTSQRTEFTARTIPLAQNPPAAARFAADLGVSADEIHAARLATIQDIVDHREEALAADRRSKPAGVRLARRQNQISGFVKARLEGEKLMRQVRARLKRLERLDRRSLHKLETLAARAVRVLSASAPEKWGLRPLHDNALAYHSIVSILIGGLWGDSNGPGNLPPIGARLAHADRRVIDVSNIEFPDAFGVSGRAVRSGEEPADISPEPESAAIDSDAPEADQILDTPFDQHDAARLAVSEEVLSFVRGFDHGFMSFQHYRSLLFVDGEKNAGDLYALAALIYGSSREVERLAESIFARHSESEKSALILASALNGGDAEGVADSYGNGQKKSLAQVLAEVIETSFYRDHLQRAFSTKDSTAIARALLQPQGSRLAKRDGGFSIFKSLAVAAVLSAGIALAAWLFAYAWYWMYVTPIERASVLVDQVGDPSAEWTPSMPSSPGAPFVWIADQAKWLARTATPYMQGLAAGILIVYLSYKLLRGRPDDDGSSDGARLAGKSHHGSVPLKEDGDELPEDAVRDNFSGRAAGYFAVDDLVAVNFYYTAQHGMAYHARSSFFDGYFWDVDTKRWLRARVVGVQGGQITVRYEDSEGRQEQGEEYFNIQDSRVFKVVPAETTAANTSAALNASATDGVPFPRTVDGEGYSDPDSNWGGPDGGEVASHSAAARLAAPGQPGSAKTQIGRIFQSAAKEIAMQIMDRIISEQPAITHAGSLEYPVPSIVADDTAPIQAILRRHMQIKGGENPIAIRVLSSESGWAMYLQAFLAYLDSEEFKQTVREHITRYKNAGPTSQVRRAKAVIGFGINEARVDYYLTNPRPRPSTDDSSVVVLTEVDVVPAEGGSEVDPTQAKTAPIEPTPSFESRITAQTVSVQTFNRLAAAWQRQVFHGAPGAPSMDFLPLDGKMPELKDGEIIGYSDRFMGFMLSESGEAHFNWPRANQVGSETIHLGSDWIDVVQLRDGMVAGFVMPDSTIRFLDDAIQKRFVDEGGRRTLSGARLAARGSRAWWTHLLIQALAWAAGPVWSQSSPNLRALFGEPTVSLVSIGPGTGSLMEAPGVSARSQWRTVFGPMPFVTRYVSENWGQTHILNLAAEKKAAEKKSAGTKTDSRLLPVGEYEKGSAVVIAITPHNPSDFTEFAIQIKSGTDPSEPVVWRFERSGSGVYRPVLDASSSVLTVPFVPAVEKGPSGSVRVVFPLGDDGMFGIFPSDEVNYYAVHVHHGDQPVDAQFSIRSPLPAGARLAAWVQRFFSFALALVMSGIANLSLLPSKGTGAESRVAPIAVRAITADQAAVLRSRRDSMIRPVDPFNSPKAVTPESTLPQIFSDFNDRSFSSYVILGAPGSAGADLRNIAGVVARFNFLDPNLTGGVVRFRTRFLPVGVDSDRPVILVPGVQKISTTGSVVEIPLYSFLGREGVFDRMGHIEQITFASGLTAWNRRLNPTRHHKIHLSERPKLIPWDARTKMAYDYARRLGNRTGAKQNPFVEVAKSLFPRVYRAWVVNGYGYRFASVQVVEDGALVVQGAEVGEDGQGLLGAYQVEAGDARTYFSGTDFSGYEIAADAVLGIGETRFNRLRGPAYVVVSDAVDAELEAAGYLPAISGTPTLTVLSETQAASGRDLAGRRIRIVWRPEPAGARLAWQDGGLIFRHRGKISATTFVAGLVSLSMFFVMDRIKTWNDSKSFRNIAEVETAVQLKDLDALKRIADDAADRGDRMRARIHEAEVDKSRRVRNATNDPLELARTYVVYDDFAHAYASLALNQITALQPNAPQVEARPGSRPPLDWEAELVRLTEGAERSAHEGLTAMALHRLYTEILGQQEKLAGYRSAIREFERMTPWAAGRMKTLTAAASASAGIFERELESKREIHHRHDARMRARIGGRLKVSMKGFAERADRRDRLGGLMSEAIRPIVQVTQRLSAAAHEVVTYREAQRKKIEEAPLHTADVEPSISMDADGDISVEIEIVDNSGDYYDEADRAAVKAAEAAGKVGQTLAALNSLLRILSTDSRADGEAILSRLPRDGEPALEAGSATAGFVFQTELIVRGIWGSGRDQVRNSVAAQGLVQGAVQAHKDILKIVGQVRTVAAGLELQLMEEGRWTAAAVQAVVTHQMGQALQAQPVEAEQEPRTDSSGGARLAEQTGIDQRVGWAMEDFKRLVADMSPNLSNVQRDAAKRYFGFEMSLADAAGLSYEGMDQDEQALWRPRPEAGWKERPQLVAAALAAVRSMVYERPQTTATKENGDPTAEMRHYFEAVKALYLALSRDLDGTRPQPELREHFLQMTDRLDLSRFSAGEVFDGAAAQMSEMSVWNQLVDHLAGSAHDPLPGSGRPAELLAIAHPGSVRRLLAELILNSKSYDWPSSPISVVRRVSRKAAILKLEEVLLNVSAARKVAGFGLPFSGLSGEWVSYGGDRTPRRGWKNLWWPWLGSGRVWIRAHGSLGSMDQYWLSASREPRYRGWFDAKDTLWTAAVSREAGDRPLRTRIALWLGSKEEDMRVIQVNGDAIKGVDLGSDADQTVLILSPEAFASVMNSVYDELHQTAAHADAIKKMEATIRLAPRAPFVRARIKLMSSDHPDAPAILTRLERTATHGKSSSLISYDPSLRVESDRMRVLELIQTLASVLWDERELRYEGMQILLDGLWLAHAAIARGRPGEARVRLVEALKRLSLSDSQNSKLVLRPRVESMAKYLLDILPDFDGAMSLGIYGNEISGEFYATFGEAETTVKWIPEPVFGGPTPDSRSMVWKGNPLLRIAMSPDGRLVPVVEDAFYKKARQFIRDIQEPDYGRKALAGDVAEDEFVLPGMATEAAAAARGLTTLFKVLDRGARLATAAAPVEQEAIGRLHQIFDRLKVDAEKAGYGYWPSTREIFPHDNDSRRPVVRWTGDSIEIRRQTPQRFGGLFGGRRETVVFGPHEFRAESYAPAAEQPKLRFRYEGIHLLHGLSFADGRIVAEVEPRLVEAYLHQPGHERAWEGEILSAFNRPAVPAIHALPVVLAERTPSRPSQFARPQPSAARLAKKGLVADHEFFAEMWKRANPLPYDDIAWVWFEALQADGRVAKEQVVFPKRQLSDPEFLDRLVTYLASLIAVRGMIEGVSEVYVGVKKGVAEDTSDFRRRLSNLVQTRLSDDFGKTDTMISMGSGISWVSFQIKERASASSPDASDLPPQVRYGELTGIGFDLGGTNLKVARRDELSGQISSQTVPLVKWKKKGALKKFIWDQILDFGNRAGSLPKHVVVTIPGPVTADGRIVAMPNLEAERPGTIQELNDLREEALQKGVEILFQNDANTAAFYWMVERGVRGGMIFNTLGTGLGFAYVADGGLGKGPMEAHLRFLYGKKTFRAPGMGMSGDLEQYANRDFVIRRARQLIASENRTRSRRAVSPIQAPKTIDPRIVGEWLKLNSSDPRQAIARQVYTEFGRHLAILYLETARVTEKNDWTAVLTGGIAQDQKVGVIQEGIQAGLAELSQVYPEVRVGVVVVPEAAKAGSFGALYLGLLADAQAAGSAAARLAEEGESVWSLGQIGRSFDEALRTDSAPVLRPAVEFFQQIVRHNNPSLPDAMRNLTHIAYAVAVIYNSRSLIDKGLLFKELSGFEALHDHLTELLADLQVYRSSVRNLVLIFNGRVMADILKFDSGFDAKHLQQYAAMLIETGADSLGENPSDWTLTSFAAITRPIQVNSNTAVIWIHKQNEAGVPAHVPPVPAVLREAAPVPVSQPAPAAAHPSSVPAARLAQTPPATAEPKPTTVLLDDVLMLKSLIGRNIYPIDAPVKLKSNQQTPLTMFVAVMAAREDAPEAASYSVQVGERLFVAKYTNYSEDTTVILVSERLSETEYKKVSRVQVVNVRGFVEDHFKRVSGTPEAARTEVEDVARFAEEMMAARELAVQNSALPLDIQLPNLESLFQGTRSEDKDGRYEDLARSMTGFLQPSGSGRIFLGSANSSFKTYLEEKHPELAQNERVALSEHAPANRGTGRITVYLQTGEKQRELAGQAIQIYLAHAGPREAVHWWRVLAMPGAIVRSVVGSAESGPDIHGTFFGADSFKDERYFGEKVRPLYPRKLRRGEKEITNIQLLELFQGKFEFLGESPRYYLVRIGQVLQMLKTGARMAAEAA